MRVATLLSGLAPGGAERVVVSLLGRLAERGERPLLVTLTTRHDGPLAEEVVRRAIERVDLGARRLADPGAAWRWFGLLERRRIDLVHAHGQDAGILAGAARRLGPPPLVLTRHVLDEPERTWRERLRARAALAAFRRADQAVAVSQAAAHRLCERSGLAPASVRVIHNGVEVERFSGREAAAAGERVRGELELPSGCPVALLLAVLRPGKGHGLALGAWPEVRRHVPGAVLLLAGCGELAPALAARVAGLDGVRMLGHREDAPALLAACDLVVLPSEAEALPTVLIEAAAAGRAVVATRVGGSGEVVEDGRTGVLVPPGDAAAFASAVAGLLAGAERRAAMGIAARARARERFTIDRQVDETLALWREVAARGTRR